MATRITILDEYNRNHEFFYKTVCKEISYAPISRKIVKCRLDVHITKIKDIERMCDFLDNLEAGIKCP
jgi:hypothetical protein